MKYILSALLLLSFQSFAQTATEQSLQMQINTITGALKSSGAHLKDYEAMQYTGLGLMAASAASFGHGYYLRSKQVMYKNGKIQENNDDDFFIYAGYVTGILGVFLNLASIHQINLAGKAMVRLTEDGVVIPIGR